MSHMCVCVNRAAANGNVDGAYVNIPEGAANGVLTASSTNPFDSAPAGPLGGSVSAVEQKAEPKQGQYQSVGYQLPQYSPAPAPVQAVPAVAAVPVAAVADQSTVPGNAEYLRAMALLCGDHNGNNKKPEEGARLMLIAAQKGHPDAASQINVIVAGAFAPSNSSRVYPSVASSPVR